MRFLSAAIGVVLLLLGVSGALAAAYHLKPGDTISVNVWQDPKLDRQLVVGPDGTIAFPLAGHIAAAGHTLQAVEAELRSKLKANYNTPLDVTIALTSATRSGGDRHPLRSLSPARSTSQVRCLSATSPSIRFRPSPCRAASVPLQRPAES